MTEENVIKFTPRKLPPEPEEQTSENHEGISASELMILMSKSMNLFHEPNSPTKQFKNILGIHNLTADLTCGKVEFATMLVKILNKWGRIAVEVLGGPDNSVSVEAHINVPPPGRDPVNDVIRFLDTVTIPMYRSTTAFSFGDIKDYHHFFVRTNPTDYTLTSVTNVMITNIKDLV